MPICNDAVQNEASERRQADCGAIEENPQPPLGIAICRFWELESESRVEEGDGNTDDQRNVKRRLRDESRQGREGAVAPIAAGSIEDDQADPYDVRHYKR